jgi:hypothetical protein
MAHPLLQPQVWPISADPDLHEMITPHRAGLDQPAHRRSVPVEGAELGIPRIGVRVEVDDADSTETQAVGNSGNIWKGDRVVTAEDDRDRAGPYSSPYHLSQIRMALLDVAGRHEHIAHIDNMQFGERVDAENQVGPPRDVRRRVAEPYRERAEAGTRTVRRPTVERRPDDHDIRGGEACGIALVSAGDSQERDVRAEHRAHCRKIGAALAAWGDILWPLRGVFLRQRARLHG